MNANKDRLRKAIRQGNAFFQRYTGISGTSHDNFEACAGQFVAGGQRHVERELFFSTPAIFAALIRSAVARVEHDRFDLLRVGNSAWSQDRLDDPRDVRGGHQRFSVGVPNGEICQESDAIDVELLGSCLSSDAAPIASQRNGPVRLGIVWKLIKLGNIGKANVIAPLMADHAPAGSRDGCSTQKRCQKENTREAAEFHATEKVADSRASRKDQKPVFILQSRKALG